MDCAQCSRNWTKDLAHLIFTKQSHVDVIILKVLEEENCFNVSTALSKFTYIDIGEFRITTRSIF